jgi:AraC-like DNA-binding protein
MPLRVLLRPLCQPAVTLLGGTLDSGHHRSAGAERDAVAQLISAQPGQIDPTYVSLTGLVDRMRDVDHLYRVEQVMQHSPWSTRTTQRIFRGYVGVPVRRVPCRYRLQHAG